MISDPTAWMRALRNYSCRLRKYRNQTRWTSVSLSLLELTTMVGFFAIRKLLESRLFVPTDLGGEQVRVSSFPARGNAVHFVSLLRMKDPGELYDLSRPKNMSIDLKKLCDTVIHSYVFCPEFDGAHRMTGIYLNADRGRQIGLLRIGLREIETLFLRVSDLRVRTQGWTVQLSYDPKAMDYRVHTVTNGAARRPRRRSH